MRDMNGNIIMGYNGIVQLLSPSTATPKRIVRKEYSTFNLMEICFITNHNIVEVNIVVITICGDFS